MRPARQLSFSFLTFPAFYVCVARSRYWAWSEGVSLFDGISGGSTVVLPNLNKRFLGTWKMFVSQNPFHTLFEKTFIYRMDYT